MILGGFYIAQAIDHLTWPTYFKNERVKSDKLTINPNSMNVTLGNEFIELVPGPKAKQEGTDGPDWIIDPLEPQTLDGRRIRANSLVIRPGEFLLGHANERVDCRPSLNLGNVGSNLVFAPMLETRSTIARLGLCCHLSAGFGDVGFKGSFTFEIYNFGPAPIRLHADMEFAQIEFHRVFVGKGAGIYEYKGTYNEIQNTGPALPILGKERFFPHRFPRHSSEGEG